VAGPPQPSAQSAAKSAISRVIGAMVEHALAQVTHAAEERM
jgi:hypothetical protein